MEDIKVIRERCSCGAEIEIVEEPNAEEIHAGWIVGHKCRLPVLDGPTGGTAQVEQAPDYTMPEMHIGFRYEA
jgi:hypothetical protein